MARGRSPSVVPVPNPRLAPIRALATLARALSVFALLGTTIPSLAEAQAPANATWSGIAPGPFAVGYRALSLHDSTRTLLPDTLAAKGPEPRVIPVRLWYPGVANARAAAVTVGGIIDRRASAVDSPRLPVRSTR